MQKRKAATHLQTRIFAERALAAGPVSASASAAPRKNALLPPRREKQLPFWSPRPATLFLLLPLTPTPLTRRRGGGLRDDEGSAVS